MGLRVLAVYPNRNTTKIGLFEDADEVRRADVVHDRNELDKFERVSEQWSYRLYALEDVLSEWGVSPDEMKIDAVVGLAGISDNLPRGIHYIDADLLNSLKKEKEHELHIDLGATLADSWARIRGARGFAVVSLAKDEFDPISKISGIPQLPFGRMMHSLNIKEAVYKASEDLGVAFEKLSVVVAYLGNSFSICSHSGGRIRDLANANERGPFSPSLSGGVPAADIVRMAYSGLWSRDDLQNHLSVSGGMKSYTDTDNLLEVAKRNAMGDCYAGLVFRSMAYQIAQEIAAQAAVLKGKVDAVVLTGGCSMDELFVEILRDKVRWITKRVLVYPKTDELKLMAGLVLKILKNQDAPHVPPEAQRGDSASAGFQAFTS